MLEESRSLPQCRPRGHAQLLQQQQSVSHAALKHPEYYALLLSELEVLGWSNVASLDEVRRLAPQGWVDKHRSTTSQSDATGYTDG